MIESFGCKQTEKIWRGIRTQKWSTEIANNAMRKLFMINATNDILDLKTPPSNRLKGNMKEY